MGCAKSKHRKGKDFDSIGPRDGKHRKDKQKQVETPAVEGNGEMNIVRIKGGYANQHDNSESVTVPNSATAKFQKGESKENNKEEKNDKKSKTKKKKEEQNPKSISLESTPNNKKKKSKGGKNGSNKQSSEQVSEEEDNSQSKSTEKNGKKNPKEKKKSKGDKQDNQNKSLEEKTPKKSKKQKNGEKKEAEEPERKENESLDFRGSDFITQTQGNIHLYYTFDKLLGKGTFGQVYSAIHKATGQKRAIKIIERSMSDKFSSSNNQKFRAEIEMLKNFDHPYILKLYEYFFDNQFIYICSELCTGGELMKLVKAQKKLSEQESAKYMFQILKAVAYCHARGIVHRDLKPNNILLADKSNQVIKVIDFGVASFLNQNQKMFGIAGTAKFVAPEILQGFYDEKCDIWSCGVMLFVFLTGEFPFVGHNKEHTLQKIRTGQIDLNETWHKLSDQAKNVVLKMLTFNHTKRPSAEQLLQHEFFLKNKKQLPYAKRGTLAQTVSQLQSYEKDFSALRQAFRVFAVSQLVSDEQQEKLRRVFMVLDKDADGTLTKQEIYKGLKKVMGKEIAKEHVKAIMKSVDANKDGTISYTEFLNAGLSSNILYSEGNLKSAFQKFDQNNKGYINFQDLKKAFGTQMSDTQLRKMVKEADCDQDGTVSLIIQINYEDFKKYISPKE